MFSVEIETEELIDPLLGQCIICKTTDSKLLKLRVEGGKLYTGNTLFIFDVPQNLTQLPTDARACKACYDKNWKAHREKKLQKSEESKGKNRTMKRKREQEILETEKR